MMTEDEFNKMGKLLRVIVREEVESKTEKLETKMDTVLDKVTEMRDQIVGDLKKNGES